MRNKEDYKLGQHSQQKKQIGPPTPGPGMGSVEKAKEILGYEPKYDLEAGLEKTIEWYRGELND